MIQSITLYTINTGPSRCFCYLKVTQLNIRLICQDCSTSGCCHNPSQIRTTF